MMRPNKYLKTNNAAKQIMRTKKKYVAKQIMRPNKRCGHTNNVPKQIIRQKNDMKQINNNQQNYTAK